MHIIFSTKYREPLIDATIEPELYSYLGGICKKLECHPIKINGFYDHVHILCILSKKITLIKLLEDVKSDSSKWIKTKSPDYSNFYWQDGYGAFSVTPDQVDNVIDYISNQKEHHKTISFQDEYRMLLKQFNVAYDERYVWD
jgi:REP element-mobilizing transposase RayT